MKVSRKTSLAIQYILDELIPPLLRDAKWFMYLPMKFVFGKHTKEIMEFKENVFAMKDIEFSKVYEDFHETGKLQGETDLNRECENKILKNITGKNVLEVGCGRGYLAKKLSNKVKLTATDIYIDPDLPINNKKISFVEANIENLPFKDNNFETVICTHTLEHVQNLNLAISELRRVTKKRLIIVVPRQRPYKYGFNLHIHFFPYDWSIVSGFGYFKNSKIINLGDWYYQEDYS